MTQMSIRLQVAATLGAGLLSSGSDRYLTTDFLVVDAMDYADTLIAKCGEITKDIENHPIVRKAVQAEIDSLIEWLRTKAAASGDGCRVDTLYDVVIELRTRRNRPHGGSES